MTTRKQRTHKKHFLFSQAILMILLVGMITAYFALVSTPRNRYVITDGDTVMTVSSASRDLNQVLAQAGISLSAADQITSSRNGSVTEVTIQRQTPDFSSQETLARPSALPEAPKASAAPLIPAPVSESDSGFRSIGEAEYAVSEAKEQEDAPERAEETLSAPPVYDAPEPAKAPESDDEEYVYQEPVYDEPAYEEPAYEEPVYEEPAYEPPSYTASYSAPSGNSFTTSSGETIYYVDVLSVEATAYTGGGTTATGTPARYGEIAVDPSYIPYGTVLYIVSDDGRWVYGTATAEDCGGAINGNIIDLYFDDYDTCIQFGRRNCTAYVISWG